MPYPSQVSRERILQVAGDLVEQGDIDTITLAQLAQTLDIKPPSLYRYFPNKASLIHALNLETMSNLTASQNAISADDCTAQEWLMRIARNYRHYALAHPQRYRLAFRAASPDEATQAQYVQLALPLQSAVSQLVSESDSLTYLRGLFALIHGFISLELSHMLQRGGDLNLTFEAILSAYLRGIQR